MNTLTDFLLVRIAEDAERCRAIDVHPADTARRLAECEAKRRIVEDLTPHDGAEGRYDFGVTEWGVMRLLALPYADHPDYREEWKP